LNKVGTGLNVTFPLPMGFLVDTAAEIPITLALTEYSFGFANVNDVITVPHPPCLLLLLFTLRWT
jgi:hypothetical protein